MKSRMLYFYIDCAHTLEFSFRPNLYVKKKQTSSKLYKNYEEFWRNVIYSFSFLSKNTYGGVHSKKLNDYKNCGFYVTSSCI